MDDQVRILQVDTDDREAARSARALAKRGWRVDRARGFHEAVELIKNADYNIAIIEMMLPEMLGTDAWRYFKVLRPDLACIIVTDSPSLRTSVNPVDDDVLAYLLKPLKMDMVCNFISRVVKRQKGEARKVSRHSLCATPRRRR